MQDALVAAGDPDGDRLRLVLDGVDRPGELLDRVGVAAWKLASGEVTNVPLIERMARNGRLVILSSGMSTLRSASTASGSSIGSPLAAIITGSRTNGTPG